MSHSVPSVSGRRSEDRGAVGRQDSSAADGPFSPAGLKVLVVDDDPMCLKVVSAMLQRCNYTVVTESNGHEALALLRQRQEEGTEQFDLVLSDVYMPDMDGFRLLEAIGLELDLPVIMMSSDGDTNVVLRGVTHGAVDFLIKPVRIEELRNVWQHVVRRRSVQISRNGDDSAADFDGDSRTHGTKRKGETETLRAEHESVSGSKKPRVVWSVEMHQQFVNAVNILGIDKAVPKRILDLMSVEGLTRENVASHLQKYRLYLKRVEGVHGGGKGGRMPKPLAVEQHAGGGTDTEEEMPQRPSLPSDQLQTQHAQHSVGAPQAAPMQPQHPGPMPMHTQPMQPVMPVQPAYPTFIGMQQHPPMAAAHVAAWQQHQTMHAMQAAAAAAAGGVMHGSASAGMSGTPMMGTNHYASQAMMPPTSYPVPHAGVPTQSMPMASPQGPAFSYSNHAQPSFAAAGGVVAVNAQPPHHTGSVHDFSALHTAQADHNNNNNNAVGPDSGHANNSNAICSGGDDPSPESVDALLPSLGGGAPLPEEPLSESLLPDMGQVKQENDHEFFDIFVHHSEAAPGP